MQNVFLAMCVLGLPFYVMLVITFDRIVSLEFQNHRSDWVIDGKPRGIIWNSKECSLLGSTFARDKLHLRWLFRTPKWAVNPEEQGLFVRLRIYAAWWILVALVSFLYWFFSPSGLRVNIHL